MTFLLPRSEADVTRLKRDRAELWPCAAGAALVGLGLLLVVAGWGAAVASAGAAGSADNCESILVGDTDEWCRLILESRQELVTSLVFGGGSMVAVGLVVGRKAILRPGLPRSTRPSPASFLLPLVAVPVVVAAHWAGSTGFLVVLPAPGDAGAYADTLARLLPVSIGAGALLSVVGIALWSPRRLSLEHGLLLVSVATPLMLCSLYGLTDLFTVTTDVPRNPDDRSPFLGGAFELIDVGWLVGALLLASFAQRRIIAPPAIVSVGSIAWSSACFVLIRYGRVPVLEPDVVNWLQQPGPVGWIAGAFAVPLFITVTSTLMSVTASGADVDLEPAPVAERLPG